MKNLSADASVVSDSDLKIYWWFQSAANVQVYGYIQETSLLLLKRHLL